MKNSQKLAWTAAVALLVMDLTLLFGSEGKEPIPINAP